MRTVVAWLIGHLLHAANADPPLLYRHWFYSMKTDILERYGGREEGVDVQRIEQVCWDCHGQETWWSGPNRCGNCGGSGIYRRVWVKPYAAGFYAFWYGEAKDIERAAVEHDLDRWLALGQPWLYWSHDREE